MLKRHRGKIFAAGLTAFFFLAAGVGSAIYFEAAHLQRSYERNADDEASNYAREGHEREERHCRQLVNQAKQDCVEEEEQAAREGQRGEYDLQAQLVTSAWTRAMGIAAIIGMGFGIVGVGLVFVTFRETRVAAAAAQGTYNAFVALERATIVAIIKEGFADHEGRLHVRLRITNIGRSTAKIYTVRFVDLQEPHAPKDFPGIARIDKVLKQDAERVDAISLPVDATNCLFVGGYVEYGSTFGTVHKSYFCSAIQKRQDTKDTIYVNQYTAQSAKDPKDDKRWPADT